MKTEVFIYYSLRVKNKCKIALENTKLLIEKSKDAFVNWITVTNYYYSEITVQTKIFKNNLKDINRF